MSKNQSFINIIHMSKFTFPCLSFQLFQLWTFRCVDFAVWNKFLFEYFLPTGKFPDWKLFLAIVLELLALFLPFLGIFKSYEQSSLLVVLIQLGMNLGLLQHWSTWPDSSFRLRRYQFTEAENNESPFSKHNMQIQCLSQEPVVLNFKIAFRNVVISFFASLHLPKG